MITPAQLNTVFPACRNPGTWVRTLDQMLDEFALRPPQRLAMFLAQTGFESESFNVMRELLSYRTPELIQSVWPREFPTVESAKPYVLNPMGLANHVYANRNGNGQESTGDGFKYRGGGLIELTGRANYKGVGAALSIDLEQRPVQIEQPLIAARTAGFFWKQNDLNAAADAGDFDYTTRKINGAAMHAAADRRALWEKLKLVMNAPTPLQVAVDARRALPPVVDGLMDPNNNSLQYRK
jgi:putative chitinase